MKLPTDLGIGDVLKGKLLDDKKPVLRTVVAVKPRTGLTQVITVQKFNPNAREVFEFRSNEGVTT